MSRGGFRERVAGYALLAAALEDVGAERRERAFDREELAEHLLERAPRPDWTARVRREAGL